MDLHEAVAQQNRVSSQPANLVGIESGVEERQELQRLHQGESVPEPDSPPICWGWQQSGFSNVASRTLGLQRRRRSALKGLVVAVMKNASIVSALVVCLLHASWSRADEPVEEYLAALQEQQYYDVALRYLDRMATSELVTAEFKEELDYRRGLLLVERSRTTSHPGRRRDYLTQAEAALQRFVSSHSSHPSAALARSQLGNVTIERARSLVKQAKAEEPVNQSLLKQAGEVYEQGHQMLVQSRGEIGEQYKQLVTNRDDERLPAVKHQYVQTYLAIARVLFEQADTLEADENAYRAKLAEAAEEFEDVAQKYRKFSAGVYALLFEGECYQKLGEHGRALTYFKELLANQDNTAPVRRLKSLAVARSVTSFVAVDKIDRAISIAEQWLASARGSEANDPAWSEVKLALAKAFQQKSTTAEKQSDANKALASARELARELTRGKAPLRKEAQTLLVSLGRGSDKEDTPDPAPAASASFAEAKEAAHRFLDDMKSASMTASILSSQLDKIRDAARKAEIEAKLSEARTKEEQSSQQALELFERAADLATDEDRDALGAVRYYLAYLYYSRERYRRAAILAGYVALREPDSLAARECANVALAARQRLYQTTAPDQRTIHSDRIVELAELMITKWPGQPQAESALSTLLDLTIQKGDLAKAQAFLDRIPEDSPRRGSAELRIGQALWRNYLQGVTAAQTQNDLSPRPELIRLKEEARRILSDGISRGTKTKPTETFIRSALSLAQIHVDAQQPAKALEVLQDERFGALHLARTNSPWATKIPGLILESYRTAIRAHVALAADPNSTQTEIKIAQNLLDELRDQLKDQPDGNARMISIYVGLARGLERQLAEADSNARAGLSKGFETFLRNAAGDSEDPTILSWVADTLYGMGKGMLDGERTSPQAQRFFTEASKTYERVIQLARTQPNALSSEQLTQLQVRRAMCYRQIGNYQQAVELFAEVLTRRTKILNVQIEAANTLQSWGRAGNPQGYWLAIQGTEPGKDGKNVIWGWGRIANIVSKNPSYRSTFHQARYNIAQCRYQLALAKSGKEQKSLLSRAKTDILATQKLFDLGGPAQRQKYETLLKSIQKSLGQPAVGFSG